MPMIQNAAIAARLQKLVEQKGCKPVARLMAIAPQTIGAATRSEPLRKSTWKKIESRLAKIITETLREKLMPLAAVPGGKNSITSIAGIHHRSLNMVLIGKPIRLCSLFLLEEALPTLEKVSKERRLCVLCDKPAVRERCWRCESKSGKRCPRCGHRHGDDLSSAFCCLLAPSDKGHCGWCGEDCERAFCDKNCSIAYHADVSKGLLGEAMAPAAEIWEP